MSPEKRKLVAQEGPSELLPEEQPKEKPHTLEEFSYKFFRYLSTPECCKEAIGLVWACHTPQAEAEPAGAHGRV